MKVIWNVCTHRENTTAATRIDWKISNTFQNTPIVEVVGEGS